MKDKLDFSLGIKQVLLLVFVLGIAVGFAAGAVTTSVLSKPQTGTADAQTPSDTGNQQPSGADSQEEDSRVSVNFENQGEPVIGQKDAPVTMVYWGDFQCQFCGKFETGELRGSNDPSTDGAFDKIKKNYIETGKVRFVSKSFTSSRHKWGQDAASIMECVYREGGNDAFWNLKNKIYENQDSFNTSNVRNKVENWASQEGVSKSAIQSCLDSGVGAEIRGDIREAINSGVKGTPGFVIYRSNSDSGTKVVGAQPYNRFKTVIDSKL